MLHPCAQHGCWGRKGAAYGTGSCLWPRNWASIPSKAWTLCSRVDSEPQENLEQRRALKAPSRSDGTCVVKIWGRGTRYCMSYFVSAIAMSVSLCVHHQPHSRFFFTQVDDQATRGCLQDSEDSSRGCVARRWMNYFVALSLLPKKMIFMSSHDVVTAFVI